MTDGLALSSAAPAVLAAWEDYLRYADIVAARRATLSERYGRRLMVNRLGLGHGTRVVGFEEFESDVDGQILGNNGELRVPKKGPPWNTVVPNARRKAGKDLAAELETLSMEGPDLPGMPSFQIVGLRGLAPALTRHEGQVWAFWADDIRAQVDLDLWSVEPLSVYYAAIEAREAAEE